MNNNDLLQLLLDCYEWIDNSDPYWQPDADILQERLTKAMNEIGDKE